MAAVYWWNDGMSASGWDDYANWWQDSTHTTPLGAAPLAFDDVYFVGSYMPTAAPIVAITLNTFDTKTYSDANWTAGGFPSGSTSNITVNGVLTFGQENDGGNFYWNGTTAIADFWGNVTNEGTTPSGTITFTYRGTSQHGAAASFSNATGGTVYFYGQTNPANAVTTPTTVGVSFSDSSTCAVTVSTGTFELSSSAILANGANISATSATLSSGEMQAGAIVAAATVVCSGATITAGTITTTNNLTISSGTVGVGDYSAGPNLEGSITSILSISGGTIYVATAQNFATYTQSGGSIIGSDGAYSTSISATNSVTLTAGSMSNSIVYSGGTASVASAYTFGAGARLAAGGEATVASLAPFANNNRGVSGSTVTISGKQTTSATHISQSGVLKLPDFTRGKNPFGGGCFT